MRSLVAALADARAGLAARWPRAVISGLGISLAAAMLSAAVVVSYGLGTGFARGAAAAGLPDIIVRFDPESQAKVAQRVTALPDIARYSLRLELTNVGIGTYGHRRDDAVAEVLDAPGHDQGYAVVSGRNLNDRGAGVLVEQGFASAWGLRIGSPFFVQGLGRQTVVGTAEGPDNVGYPLAKPRFYLSRPAIDARLGREPQPEVNLAEIWLRDPRYLNSVLVQARATSFGLRNIQFATREGVRTLLDQAAGIVIDLLVALSLIALATAGVMLAASARAEVQRRLGAIGVRRALGASRGFTTLSAGLEGLLVALPACSLGLLAGTLATYAPADRLLTMLNEPPPGGALILPLALTWLAGLLLPSAGAAWPAWRATRGSIVSLLRGADVGSSRATRSPGGRTGLGLLGARLVTARRSRWVATALTLALSTAFALLMIVLAAELSTLETDPGALGKRYQLTAALPPSDTGRVAAIKGVEAVEPRYEVQAADSYQLGETIDVIAYPGDHTVFEAPPLTSGHRLRGNDQAEVGQGLAQALGLRSGSILALAVSDGTELRLRVSGVVSSLDHDGRVAYVPAAALLRADPGAPSELAVVVAPSANQSAVQSALAALGSEPSPATGATARGVPLVNVLRTILLGVAIIDGLVCLYVLVQACALTLQERRRTVAILQACGAGAPAVGRLLLGAALVLVLPAAILGILLERLLLGPELSRLAESYAALPLVAGPGPTFAVLAGLAIAVLVAVGWATSLTTRSSVVEGLAA